MDDPWQLLLLSLSLALSTLLILAVKHHLAGKRLPPGPAAFPIVGNLLWLTNSISNIESLLRDLHARYGPIVTLRIGSSISIFVSDPQLAHQALIEHGIAFADRPKPNFIRRFLSNDRHTITSAPYGPLWRLLRRNLAAEILQPSRVKMFSGARAWVLDVLLTKLRSSSANGPVGVMESFQFAMFCLLVLMCFGEKLGEEEVKAIEHAQRDFLLYGRKLSVFAFFPAGVGKYLFRSRWNTVLAKRQRQMELYLPLIKARRAHKLKKQEETEERFVHSYVDSLLDIKIEDEGGRGLTDGEIVSLSSEFLNAGTDTTSTALQWIMAELVKHQDIQQKLFDEINQVMANCNDSSEVKEEHLNAMSYLKAVVLEGLRRHPPAHFVLPHAVREEVSIGGYVIPKEASVNFMVAEIGTNEQLWDKPLEFKPERFMDSGENRDVDVTGTREIKMMPFGVGRRICPGLGLAMLHLEYFVANLVREFEWKAVDGYEVDLAEKTEFTVVMKNPLKAHLIPRELRKNN